jgi:hypothetical protein
MTGDEQNDHATRNLPSSQQSDQSGLKEQSPARSALLEKLVAGSKTPSLPACQFTGNRYEGESICGSTKLTAGVRWNIVAPKLFLKAEQNLTRPFAPGN